MNNKILLNYIILVCVYGRFTAPDGTVPCSQNYSLVTQSKLIISKSLTRFPWCSFWTHFKIEWKCWSAVAIYTGHGFEVTIDVSNHHAEFICSWMLLCFSNTQASLLIAVRPINCAIKGTKMINKIMRLVLFKSYDFYELCYLSSPQQNNLLKNVKEKSRINLLRARSVLLEAYILQRDRVALRWLLFCQYVALTLATSMLWCVSNRLFLARATVRYKYS